MRHRVIRKLRLIALGLLLAGAGYMGGFGVATLTPPHGPKLHAGDVLVEREEDWVNELLLRFSEPNCRILVWRPAPGQTPEYVVIRGHEMQPVARPQQLAAALRALAVIRIKRVIGLAADLSADRERELGFTTGTGMGYAVAQDAGMGPAPDVMVFGKLARASSELYLRQDGWVVALDGAPWIKLLEGAGCD